MAAISLNDFQNQTQNKMKKALVMKVTAESVFFRILRFVPVDGLTYEYGEMSNMPGVAFRALGENYSPDSGVINPKAETLAILGGTVQTDRQLAQLRGGVARTNAILAKARNAALFYDHY